MNKIAKDLLEKPMNRKDFLKHVGVGALFVAGGGMILNAMKLQEQVGSGQQSTTATSFSYGSRVYGGSKVQA